MSKECYRSPTPRWHDQVVIGTEIHFHALYQPPEPLWDHLLLCNHHYIVVHGSVHNKVEDCGREGVALCHLTEAHEIGDMIFSRICFHDKLDTVRSEDPDLLGPHIVSYQDFRAQIFFQVI